MATLSTLPAPLLILLGSVVLLLGLLTTFYGARSFDIGRYWGTTRGISSRKGFCDGGIGGAIVGGLLFGLLASLAIEGIKLKAGRQLSDSWSISIILLSSFPGIILSARYRFLALTFLPVLASLATTLLLSKTIPPLPLLGRLILLALFLPLSIILVHLPRTTKQAKMILSASAGALFVVVAIDFLADVGFREVGGLLLVKRLDGAGNGARGGMGAREKGLLVGWWAFLLAGIAAQIYIGPNDVESEWNTYLRSLIETHSTPSRSGIFIPPPSFLSRFFSLFKIKSASDSNSKSTELPGGKKGRKFAARRRRGGAGEWDEEEGKRMNEEWDSTISSSSSSSSASSSDDDDDDKDGKGEEGEEDEERTLNGSEAAKYTLDKEEEQREFNFPPRPFSARNPPPLPSSLPPLSLLHPPLLPLLRKQNSSEDSSEESNEAEEEE